MLSENQLKCCLVNKKREEKRNLSLLCKIRYRRDNRDIANLCYHTTPGFGKIGAVCCRRKGQHRAEDLMGCQIATGMNENAFLRIVIMV